MIKQLIDVFFVFNSIPDQYKIQEMCDRVVFEDPFLIVYCPDKYKTQRMYDEAADNTQLKLDHDWFVTSKVIKKLFTALYTDENILYLNEDSGNVVFSWKWVFLTLALRILILIIILMKMILTLLLLSDFWLGILNLKNVKHLKNDK